MKKQSHTIIIILAGVFIAGCTTLGDGQYTIFLKNSAGYDMNDPSTFDKKERPDWVLNPPSKTAETYYFVGINGESKTLQEAYRVAQENVNLQVSSHIRVDITTTDTGTIMKTPILYSTYFELEIKESYIEYYTKMNGKKTEETYMLWALYAIPVKNIEYIWKITSGGTVAAVAKASQQALKNIPAKSKIAIVYITAQDKSTTEYIVGELEYIWVNEGYFITDRSQLDKLRQEQNFQMSGEVDDDTAVSIGRFAGADIIITGRVDGSGNLRRLRLRVINTQTAQVIGAASESL